VGILLADLVKITLRRDDHPGLPLDGLYHEGRGVKAAESPAIQ